MDPMASWPRWLILTLTLVSANPALAGTEISAYITLTTDYVFRGVSFSDSDPAAQAGVDLDSSTGLFAGIWLSTSDIPGSARKNRRREANYYAGYARRFGGRWSGTLSVTRYVYPGAPGVVDYDYTEVMATIGYRDRLWFEYAWTTEFQGHDSDARYVAVLRSWRLPAELTLTAGAGYLDAAGFAEVRYWHWQAGLARRIGRFAADLRYHDTSGADRPFSSDDTAGPRLVLSLSAYF